MPSEPRCELCDLPLGQCAHSSRPRRSPQPDLILISPKGVAHVPGCQHKGDDPDFSRWAEIRDVPRAWEKLGNGEAISATGGAVPGLVAVSRCKDCAYLL
ncbi:hypothetical protein SAMN05421805_103551 [Saccharopolyspora antimicrobica]|uniref:Uncharacterized protein n=1 Tax=Saccharopolyspora antimicrobica TaxID=455193 RepID=A0A1I4XR12_9PSEU|nr:hypothetical protein [Saccharopolyspora antimicrobica]RKT84612.1 hypothetical protein ATL45_2935 [Saccharopolyspora antimicrobica]SFN28291.1 hypothetical protein SAMN05421805_103551 [Saccharopolyspora antimicrobica]